ncbi:hypothetical protein [Flavobacterium foetidum]|uniref:hypothetical protein n=1 Tax=Flavobacterium foetidum TaxID=2026681 RepID=UPI0010751C84|nr:hypothetical protein [Flavobacterium foetidum]KAF2513880.1 hypothetical protein E0W73_13715 [Flavobacterium foetidum]
MKSQNKKLTAILIYFFSLLNSYAQSDVNKLFFNLPLEASRDTIYDAIKQYGFIKKGTKGILTQNDVTIKTFYGYLDPKIAKDV